MNEETIFEQALAIESAQPREEFLRTACAGDEAMFQRLHALLRAHDRAGKFAEHVRSESLPSLAGRSAASPSTALTEKPGDRIGRYKLLQKIGEGGCGVVYMAEQEEPVRRRVALKIIKLGMDTRQVIARFEAERQALALMDHPNIAKVFDAGSTETSVAQASAPAGSPGVSPGLGAAGGTPPQPAGADAHATLSPGRPYFVMELVRGVKITEYCDEKKLTTHERLELFMQVCRAVQHAHQKGIIHRDLKPSNILVSEDDGHAVPKIIDFGIAKATSGEPLTDKTVFTAFEQLIGTPAYMSPEQALVTNVDVDTRADIYALGVLLYELLTGQTPFDPKELMQAGLDEMRRTIREKEPDRPSTRVSSLPDAQLDTAAQRRGLEAPKLVSQLRGDLDWIVMKCLEKDRARRYETANGLASDIERHLNNEAVLACPPTLRYRLVKFVRKRRAAVAVAAAFTLLLVGATAISSVWAIKAHRAGAQAMKSEQEARAILQFFEEKILAAPRGGTPSIKRRLGPEARLIDALDAAEASIANSFSNQPLAEASIRRVLGTTYSDLLQPTKAIQQQERALALRRQYDGPDSLQTLVQMRRMASTYTQGGKIAEAISLGEETLRLMKTKLGLSHPDTIETMFRLSIAYRRAGRHNEAVKLAHERFKLTEAKFGSAAIETLNVMEELADAYYGAGRLQEAASLLEQILHSCRSRPDAVIITCRAMAHLADTYFVLGRRSEFLALRNKCFEFARTNLGPNYFETLSALTALAYANFDAGQFDKAISQFEEAVTLSKMNWGADSLITAERMRGLGRAYRAVGRIEEAIPVLAASLETFRNIWGTNRSATIREMFLLGRALIEAGQADAENPTRGEQRLREGEQLLREHLVATRAKYTDGSAEVDEAFAGVAELYYRLKKYKESEPFYREIVELRQKRLGRDHKLTIEVTASWARTLADWAWIEHSDRSQNSDANSPATQRAREAENLLRECISPPHSTNLTAWRVADFKSRLGGPLVSVAATDSELSAEARLAKLNEAEDLLLEANERLQLDTVELKYKRDSVERLMRLYEALGKPEKLSQWQQQFAKLSAAERVPSETE